MPLPAYYSSLGPFRDSFRGTRPMLMYHHVRRPRTGARIKGLYVPPALFGKQMRELQQAGFTTPPYQQIFAEPRDRADIFLTFDDGFVDVFEHALPVLRQQGFRSIQFLVTDLLGKTNEWQQREGDVEERLMDEAQIRDWIGAGQEIGSHTRTHPRLTLLNPEVAREEISASKKFLEDRFGMAVDHFCYPYGDWNQQVRDLVAEAGYKTACTTEPGLNVELLPLSLKRFTARYPSRNLKQIWAGWFSRR